MVAAALWGSVASFALLLAAWMVEFFLYARYRHPWQVPYLLVMGSFSAWLILSDFVFFSFAFGGVPLESWDRSLGMARVALSATGIWGAPAAACRIAGKPFPKPLSRGTAAAAAAMVISAVVVVAADPPWKAAWGVGITVSFFAWMVAWWSVAWARRRSYVDGSAAGMGFVFGLLAVHFAWSFADGFFLSFPLDAAGQVGSEWLLEPLYAGAWGAATLVLRGGLLFARPAPDGLPAFFAERYGMTPREREVAALLARGISNKEIADELFIGERTVETHAARIMAKCGVPTRARFVALVGDAERAGKG